jgi:hypothetical protein
MRVSKTGGTPASDLLTGISSATYGGTLSISNATSDSNVLIAGDTFTLFSARSQSGNFGVVSGSPSPGLAYSFNPVNGVLSVIAIASNPTNISFSVSGTTLSLTWPADHLGWIAQSNSITIGSPGFWHDIPGSQSGTNLDVTLNPAQAQVFYRLRHP